MLWSYWYLSRNLFYWAPCIYQRYYTQLKLVVNHIIHITMITISKYMTLILTIMMVIINRNSTPCVVSVSLPLCVVLFSNNLIYSYWSCYLMDYCRSICHSICQCYTFAKVCYCKVKMELVLEHWTIEGRVIRYLNDLDVWT